jgi:autotransporter-associated beta strand protein
MSRSKRSLARIICPIAGITAAGISLVPTSAFAVTYTDALGDQSGTSPNYVDISSVQVTNDSTYLVMNLNLNPTGIDITSTAAGDFYGKYLIGLQTGPGGNTSTTASDAYGVHNIGISTGMNYEVESWTDDILANTTAGRAGYTMFNWSGSAWTAVAGETTAQNAVMTNTFNPVETPSSLTYFLPLYAFSPTGDISTFNGLTFKFDVYTTFSGSQSAYDALDSGAAATQATGYQPWNNIAYDSATATGSTFNTTTYSILNWNNTGGTGDGATWDAANQNWGTGNGPGAYADGASVLFADNNGGHYAVTLNSTVSPVSVNVNNSAGNYTISGTGSITGSGGLTKAGTGSLTLSTVNSYTGSTTVNAGTLIAGVSGALPANQAVFINNTAILQLATGSGLQTLSGLTIATGATFDINNDHVLITYTGTSPGSTYLALLKASKAAGWTGTGIISTAASTHSAYGIAYGDGGDPGVKWLSSGTIKMSYTLNGDINQDGVVNGTDFGILAGNFGKSVTGGWEQGDLNYDGTVNGTDFGLLAGNFGKSDSGASIALPASQWAALDAFAAAHGLLADVPEPTAASLAVLACTGLAARRRRRD